MISPETTAAWAEAERLSAHFVGRGAEPVEAAILQPADLLLDLYGEDIRARAYVTADPLRGEMMLRPDFTVPLVQMHMGTSSSGGGDPARYTYAGEVFRRQETSAARANEYLQVGYELFGGGDPAEGDAEVFAVIAGALEGLGLEARIGDWGLVVAAVRGLATSEARKAALLRHIWRPARLRALLDRFGGVAPVPPTRAALLERADPFVGAGPEIGLRSRAEVEARVAALRADAAEPPVSAAERAGLAALLALEAPAPEALERLRRLAGTLDIGAAVERMAARLSALEARGIAVEALAFRASSGWTALEYYDGFVFGLFAPGQDQAVATGGRYDALTEALGGRRVPAVGGVVRPDLVVAARARA